MKKFGFALILIVLAALGGFFWLLTLSSASHAPSDPVVIDLPDTFEK